jgi:hypothetical protein
LILKINGNKIVKYIADSPEIEAINEEMIELIKQHRTLKVAQLGL